MQLAQKQARNSIVAPPAGWLDKLKKGDRVLVTHGIGAQVHAECQPAIVTGKGRHIELRLENQRIHWSVKASGTIVGCDGFFAFIAPEVGHG
jgi:preprotein translocase subunit YajC